MGKPKTHFSSQWVEVGRTEIVEDSLNPQFVKAIEMVYYFEQDQKIKVSKFSNT